MVRSVLVLLILVGLSGPALAKSKLKPRLLKQWLAMKNEVKQEIKEALQLNFFLESPTSVRVKKPNPTSAVQNKTLPPLFSNPCKDSISTCMLSALSEGDLSSFQRLFPIDLFLAKSQVSGSFIGYETSNFRYKEHISKGIFDYIRGGWKGQKDFYWLESTAVSSQEQHWLLGTKLKIRLLLKQTSSLSPIE